MDTVDLLIEELGSRLAEPQITIDFYCERLSGHNPTATLQGGRGDQTCEQTPM